MSIHTNCPGCQSQFELQDELAGQQVQCQNCQTVFTAPQPTAQMPTAPSPQAAPKPAATQDTFASVFDEVSSTSGPADFSSAPEPAYSNPSSRHQPKPAGSKKGLVIGGVLGCGFLLLCAIGVGGWFAYQTFAGGSSSKSLDLPDDMPKEFKEHLEKVIEEQEKREQDMIDRHGADKIARIMVSLTQDPGTGSSPTRYLADVAKKALDNTRSSVICKQDGAGKYEVLVGPVDDLQQFADRLTWANVTKVDRRNRVITANATLPEDLASSTSRSPRRNNSEGTQRSTADIAADLAKQRQAITKANEASRKIREQERLAAKKQRELEMKANAQRQLAVRERIENQRAITDADMNHVPRPGESMIQWLQRSLEETPTSKGVFEQLAKMDVESIHLETVSNLLIEYQRENGSSNLEGVLDAMFQWRTEATDQQILSLVGDPEYRLKGKPLMKALEKIGTEEAAEKLAVALTDHFSGDGSVSHLIRMGEKAETPVLKYRKNQNPDVRRRVYRVLSEIGTQESIELLKPNRSLEKDPQMKQLVRDALAEIQERHPPDSSKD